MFNKKIEEYMKNSGEGIVVDYINGQFVIENKSFVDGEFSNANKMKAFGSTLEVCIENFVYQLEKIEIKKDANNESDFESYHWHCSY